MIKAIALIVPLGLDTLAVSAALGAAGLPSSSRLRMSALFAAFETVMPLIGLALGVPLGHAIGALADYVAVALLFVVGAHSFVETRAHRASRPQPDDSALLARTRGPKVLGLGLSISVDELAIGVTIGLLRLPVAVIVVAVGVQAFVFAQLGLRLGARLGRGVGQRAEQLAGVALMALAGALLIETLA